MKADTNFRTMLVNRFITYQRMFDLIAGMAPTWEILFFPRRARHLPPLFFLRSWLKQLLLIDLMVACLRGLAGDLVEYHHRLLLMFHSALWYVLCEKKKIGKYTQNMNILHYMICPNSVYFGNSFSEVKIRTLFSPFIYHCKHSSVNLV